jgi:PAS domain S-box-containing protein
MAERSKSLTPDAQLFRNAFNASPIGIVIENLDGQPLFVNPAFCSMLGFSEQELQGKHGVQFSPPEDAEKDWTLFQQLRAGSIDHYQLEKRYFRADGSLMWGHLSISLLRSSPSPLVMAMVEEITDKKRAEEALRASEDLLKIFVKNVPAGVAMLDRDMRYLQVSDRWCADYSLDSSQAIGRSHYELYPDCPQRWKEMHRRGFDGETLRAEEDRWDRDDGTVTWVRWEIRPWRTSSGTIGGILIFAEDITRRKKMEEAISGMSRKLIESQEQERARIGRELHDDINQRLAMLAVELEQLQGNPSDVESHLQELRKRTIEISNDVQALSHELHSSKLEYLGAVKGMKSWCEEFGERQGIQIEFKSTELQSSVAPEIGLCLFRVLQEALHNASKHSGARRVEVQLREDQGEIHLVIRDSGRGFDSETAMQGRGLGLVSMRERVRMVNGTIAVESVLNDGTTIHVRVPLSPTQISGRAVGY